MTELSQKEWAAKGGNATFKKYGPEYMSELGKKKGKKKKKPADLTNSDAVA